MIIELTINTIMMIKHRMIIFFETFGALATLFELTTTTSPFYLAVFKSFNRLTHPLTILIKISISF